jgi:hypothetical protein
MGFRIEKDMESPAFLDHFPRKTIGVPHMCVYLPYNVRPPSYKLVNKNPGN